MPFYLGALVIAAPFVLGLFGYGLAHASENALGQLMLMLAVVFIVLFVPPLALLNTKPGPIVAGLQTIAIVPLLIGTFGLLKLLHFLVIEPVWTTVKFQHAMRAIGAVKVQEQSIHVDGRLAGVKIIRDLELKHDVALDIYGEHVREVIDRLYVSPADPTSSMSSAFSYEQRRPETTFANRPLDEVVAAEITAEARAAAKTLQQLEKLNTLRKLPRGIYRTEQTFFLWGLDGSDVALGPCRRDTPHTDDEIASYAAASNTPLQVTSFTRMDLGMRRGYSNFELPAVPIRYRYEHSTWMRALPQLAIESCEVRAARKQAADAEVKRIQNEAWYAAGDSRLQTEDNPLFNEMCAGDLAAVQSRLALGTPKFSLSGKLYECTITRSDPAMFALVLPALRVRDDEHKYYCDILRSVHAWRKLPHIEALIATHQPLQCSDAEDPITADDLKMCDPTYQFDRCLNYRARGSQTWRAGVVPYDEHGSPEFAPEERTDTLAWLKLIQSQGIAICETAKDGTNLLQDVVRRYHSDVIAFLLQSRCDPQAPQPINPHPQDHEITGYTPSKWWYFRRSTDSTFFTTPLDDAPINNAISRAMGPHFTPEEIDEKCRTNTFDCAEK